MTKKASGQPLGPTELSPGVWGVKTSIIPPEGGGPNAGFIISDNEVLIIDSLMSPECGKQLLGYLRQITDLPPKYLINTHHHGDHVFGNEIFSPPAIVIAHENARKALVTRGTEILAGFTRMWSKLIPDIGETKLVPPHITFKNHMSMYVAGHKIELIYCGIAHSRGDTVVYLPDEKILFAGDIFLNGIMPPMFGSSMGLIEALEQLEKLDVDIIVPGHGDVATKDDLSDFKHAIMDLRTQVKDCFFRDLTLAQTIKQIDLPSSGWISTTRFKSNAEFIYKELREEQLG